MTPELKRALRQLSMSLPEAEAFVRLLKGPRDTSDVWFVPPNSSPWIGWASARQGDTKVRLTPQGRFVAEALVRLGVTERNG